MSLISAVTARGRTSFMIKEKGGGNADVREIGWRLGAEREGKFRHRLAIESAGRFAVIEFLKRLMVGATHPTFLIVDRGPAHRVKKTKAFVVETLGGKLRLFFLPPCSPDRNPDELV